MRIFILDSLGFRIVDHYPLEEGVILTVPVKDEITSGTPIKLEPVEISIEPSLKDFMESERRAERAFLKEQAEARRKAWKSNSWMDNAPKKRGKR